MSSEAKKEIEQLRGEDPGCVDFTTMVFTYGCYHGNIVNKLIHMFGIPVIVYSLFPLILHGLSSQTMAPAVDALPLPEELDVGFTMDKAMMIFILALYIPLTLMYTIADIGVGVAWICWTLPFIYFVFPIYKQHKDDSIMGMSQLQFLGLC